MGKKKFIDKKKSATFHLMARDSSDPNYDDSPGNDRVFVRVDNNAFSTELENPDSVFGDAPEDCGTDGDVYASPSLGSASDHPLPEHVRKEILELGFPDDGYNYLLHMREIKNVGGGSALFNNPKTNLDQIPSDVKAYDASRLRISELGDDQSEKYMYNVASKTVGVRVQRVVDPDVAALLDDGDISRFGSDVEDLEEDFVIQANVSNDSEALSNDRDVTLPENIESEYVVVEKCNYEEPQVFTDLSSQSGAAPHFTEAKTDSAVENPRVRRLLDEQFDLLESQEYGDEGDEYNYIAQEGESLAEKFNHVLNGKKIDDFDIDGKYQAPADLLNEDGKPKSAETLESAKHIIQRCVEYAEKYENGDQVEEVVLMEQSSDESEVWDCETIVTTYSNLDNHPGKIEAPCLARKKKLAVTVTEASNSSNPKITLKGRAKIPVDFLPGRKPAAEKSNAVENLKTQQPKRKQHGQETLEEKKERKAGVKKERCEARRLKKEMKELFKGEAHHAQRVAATSGPSSIHLM